MGTQHDSYVASAEPISPELLQEHSLEGEESRGHSSAFIMLNVLPLLYSTHTSAQKEYNKSAGPSAQRHNDLKTQVCRRQPEGMPSLWIPWD